MSSGLGTAQISVRPRGKGTLSRGLLLVTGYDFREKTKWFLGAKGVRDEVT